MSGQFVSSAVFIVLNQYSAHFLQLAINYTTVCTLKVLCN